jgi:uncharacterized membrane protein
MAATFKDIIVNVVDDSGKALANAAVTLLGGTSPQVLQTDASGNCTFKEVPPGNYRLIIASEGFNTRLHTVTHSATADSNVKINMKVVDHWIAVYLYGRTSICFCVTSLQRIQHSWIGSE